MAAPSGSSALKAIAGVSPGRHSVRRTADQQRVTEAGDSPPFDARTAPADHPTLPASHSLPQPLYGVLGPPPADRRPVESFVGRAIHLGVGHRGGVRRAGVRVSSWSPTCPSVPAARSSFCPRAHPFPAAPFQDRQHAVSGRLSEAVGGGADHDRPSSRSPSTVDGATGDRGVPLLPTGALARRRDQPQVAPPTPRVLSRPVGMSVVPW